jgi:2-polyprenyl-3-methyl-5-hydroxy-6-metoxy-1,4-benzoquinol methylase
MDNSTDRERWNAKFLAGEAQSVDPDSLLVEVAGSLSPGRALDLAGGAGRHALWLAQSGWTAVLTDVSDQGLSIATHRAVAASVPLTTRRESAAETLAWAKDHPFDLILVVWCLVRDCFAALPSALAPGGTLVYKTYTSAHTRYSEGHALIEDSVERRECGSQLAGIERSVYRESNGVAELVARSQSTSG